MSDKPSSAHQAKQSSHLAPRDEHGAWQSLRFTNSAHRSFQRQPSAHLDGARWLLCWRILRSTALHDVAAKLGRLLLFIAILTPTAILTSCDKKAAEAPQASKPAAEAPQASWREWIAKSADTGWWQQQWSQASEAAKASLEALKVDEVKKQLAELAAAFEAKDLAKVEGIALELGENLNLNRFEQGFRFVILQRKEGGEAALQAIQAYAARTDLNELEKAAAQNLQKTAAFLQRDDFRGWTYAAIFFACECKLGAHRGGLLAIPIISILFPDYLEKQGPNLKL